MFVMDNVYKEIDLSKFKEEDVANTKEYLIGDEY